MAAEKPFKLSEEAEVVNLTGEYSFLNGHRVDIIGGLETREYSAGIVNYKAPAYRVLIPDGRVLIMTPEALRRPAPVRGNMDQKITWAECSWQPKEGWQNDY